MEQAKTKQCVTKLYCIENRKVQHFCFNSECLNSALICSDSKCKCVQSRHQDCGLIYSEKFINKILSKKLDLSTQLKTIFDAIDQTYVNMIQKLSEYRQQFSLMIQNYGLNAEETSFLQLIQNGLANKITGKLVHQIKIKINISNDISGIREAEVYQYWLDNESQFISIIQKLKKLYSDKRQIKTKKFQWQKQIQKQGYKIQGKLITRIKLSQIQNYTSLNQALSSEDKSYWGFKLHKINNNCSLGIAQKNTQKAFLGQKQLSYTICNTGAMYNGGVITLGCGFLFTNGDTIYFMYDPLTNQLKISRNQSDAFCVFKNTVKSNTFFPIILAPNIGDSIELITDIPKIDWNRPTITQNFSNFNPILFDFAVQPSATNFDSFGAKFY